MMKMFFLSTFSIESYSTATGLAQNMFMCYALFHMVHDKKLTFDYKLGFCSQKDKVQRAKSEMDLLEWFGISVTTALSMDMGLLIQFLLHYAALNLLLKKWICNLQTKEKKNI